MYAFKEYAPEFRLGIVQDGMVTIYKADTNPNAKIGKNLLEIRGVAVAIDLLREEDEAKVLRTIKEGRSVSRIVNATLTSPVNPKSRDRGGDPIPFLPQNKIFILIQIHPLPLHGCPRRLPELHSRRPICARAWL